MAWCCSGNNLVHPRLTEEGNREGIVNILDLILVAQNFGTTKSDFNGDSTTNILDLIEGIHSRIYPRETPKPT